MNEKSVSGEEHTTLNGRSAQKKSKLLKNPVAETSGRKRKMVSVRSLVVAPFLATFVMTMFITKST